MIAHAEQMREAGIPYVFDPGQGLPMFNGEELLHFIAGARWVAVNDYESELVQERTGLGPAAIAERVEACIVTRGAEGSRIYTAGEVIEIPPATPSVVRDPTGCGDAYRAGLLYGLMHDLPWDTTGRIASLLGAVKIEHAGTQNHRVDREAFAARYQREFGRTLDW